MNGNRTDLFENYPIPKAAAVLCIPTLLSTLVAVLYSLADTYFVGMLADPIETAAVALAAPILLAFNAVSNLFGTGGSSLMSRSLGTKEYDIVKKCSVFCIYCAVACGMLISLVYSIFSDPVMTMLGVDDNTRTTTERYLMWTVSCGAAPAILNVVMSNMVRSEGAALHAGIGVMSGCFLNIILDPLFVLPQFLNMGAAGAGLATFISNCFACLYYFVLLFVKRNNTYISIAPKFFCFDRRITREVFSVGVPASIQNLLNVTGSVILNNFTSVYGADAVSAMGIAHKVSLIPWYICFGISQGIMPLVSYNYASGNRIRMKKGIDFVLVASLAYSALVTAALLFFASPVVRIFMDNDIVVEIGTVLLRGMSIALPFLTVDFLAVAVFQATGKGKYSLVFAILRKIVLEIPAIILLNRIWPLYGMGLSSSAAECILSAAAAVMLYRITHEKHESGKYQAVSGRG